jgi:putative oxidoreductase
MNPSVIAPAGSAASFGLRLLARAMDLCARIPSGLIALVGRVSIAAVFWRSAQTKVEGFAIDLLEGQFQFGVPRLSDSALALFRDEYRLPLLAPEFAAPLAALGEHLFAAMLLFGLATRFSALALLGMTAVIQLFVYPGAWPTHGTWAAVLLYLVANGPGAISLDHWLARRQRATGSMRANRMA